MDMNHNNDKFLPEKYNSYLDSIEKSINEHYTGSVAKIMKSICDALKSSTAWEYIDGIRPLKIDDENYKLIIEFSNYFIINIMIKNEKSSTYFAYEFFTNHIDTSNKTIDKKSGFMTVSQLMVRVVLIISRFSRFYKLSPDKVKQIVVNLIDKNHKDGFVEEE
jgi:hypothetical protein